MHSELIARLEAATADAQRIAALEAKLAVAREALEKVVACETPSANATTRRMAEHARQALKEIKI